MTHTNDAPVTVEQQDRDLFKQIERLCRMKVGATDPWDDAVQLIARHRLAALAAAPAEQEAAFRAGTEAMQRALADALCDHLNPRAAAIANGTPLPE